VGATPSWPMKMIAGALSRFLEQPSDGAVPSPANI
jgi:hypothetical protein